MQTFKDLRSLGSRDTLAGPLMLQSYTFADLLIHLICVTMHTPNIVLTFEKFYLHTFSVFVYINETLKPFLLENKFDNAFNILHSPNVWVVLKLFVDIV